MPVFSPRRYQPPYYPFKRDPLAVRAFTTFERSVKGFLFGCRMCGNCILQETAFICPMTCPKGLRNGPCGGSTPERCYGLHIMAVHGEEIVPRLVKEAGIPQPTREFPADGGEPVTREKVTAVA